MQIPSILSATKEAPKGRKLSNSRVKGLTVNVGGLNKSIKRRALFRWLQETYSSVETAKIWETEWDGKVLFSHGSSHSKGVMRLPSYDSV